MEKLFAFAESTPIPMNNLYFQEREQWQLGIARAAESLARDDMIRGPRTTYVDVSPKQSCR